jgi:hypothetical protein
VSERGLEVAEGLHGRKVMRGEEAGSDYAARRVEKGRKEGRWVVTGEWTGQDGVSTWACSLC